MEQLLNFFADNKIVTGIISILIIMFGPALFSNIKHILLGVKGLLPSFKSARASVDLELADQNAIRHLRDRATQFGDEVLVKEIKSIDSKFYDIHAKKGSITNG